MTVNRSFNFMWCDNTMSINEKPFASNIFFKNNVRVYTSFCGKVIVKVLYNLQNQFKKKIIPYHLSCAISCEKVVLFHINENPINLFIEKVF